VGCQASSRKPVCADDCHFHRDSSAINSLTLSPALAALLLAGHDVPKDALTRG
jgi:hypothetical protein